MAITWRCTGVSVPGNGHIKRGVPCQDANGWAVLNDFLVLAAADGAGSARYAEKGSVRAVEGAIDYLVMRGVGDLLGRAGGSREKRYSAVLLQAFRSAHRAVAQAAALEGATSRDLATTLLVMVVGPDCAAAGQIGDGAIVYAGQDPGCAMRATTPLQREHVNETEFLTQANFLDCVRVGFLDGRVEQLALLTDGLEPLAITYRTQAPLPGFFRGLFEFMKQSTPAAIREQAVERLLRAPYLAERSDDDKTLLLAARRA
jgi:hypothetical protein